MANAQPIGFFDSGVGLLSVLIETQNKLPQENFVIFADQGNNPYGEKTKAQIRRFTKDATNFLIYKHNIKMMVLACNTATVLGLDYIRSQFTIPIIGTVPAIKPAVKKSKLLKIAVMSTPATAKSKYLKDLVAKYAKNADVLKLGCAGLEEAIEVLDKQKIDEMVNKYSKKILNHGADIVVLGCTHYPLVIKSIQNKLPKNVRFVDSGLAIAKRVDEILTQNSQKAKLKSNKDVYYTTGNAKEFSRVSSIILNCQINAQKV